jgi:2-amino-4-hydroxy-6-hydroxymethyldihydropteridine diphosphokinase
LKGFLGLGSNVGDRLANLLAAVDALNERGVTVVNKSSVYETAPHGEILDQPDFLNAVLEIDTDFGPEELLDVCKDVERALGRQSGQPRHSPRPIDVDLLLLDQIEWVSDRLTLPHAEVTSRRFVLEPLLELDPDLALPNGTRLADALPPLMEQPVRRTASL